MNIIDSYQFGRIVVNGKQYVSDVIIFPDIISDNWRRRTGHQLCLEDITSVIAEAPEVLVVGSGASGLMQQMSTWWESRARAAGFEGASPFDPRANIFVSGYLIYRSPNSWHHWVCS